MANERDQAIADEEFWDEEGTFTHFEYPKCGEKRLTNYVLKNKIRNG